MELNRDLNRDLPAYTLGENDPVRADQSKFADENGALRYSADGSRVFPGETGVRTVKSAAWDGAEWAIHARIRELAIEIEDTYRGAHIPEHQLCELASLEEMLPDA